MPSLRLALACPSSAIYMLIPHPTPSIYTEERSDPNRFAIAKLQLDSIRDMQRVEGPHSSAVYMSNSSPLLRLLSTGSGRISTPGPTRCASFLCEGKIYKSLTQQSAKAHLNHANPTMHITTTSTIPNNPPRPKQTEETYLRPTPPQPPSKLMRHQFPKPEHQTIDKRQQDINRRAPQNTPESWRRV